MRISVKRSSSEAIVSAEDGYSDMMDFKSSNEWLVLCVNLLLVLLQLLTCGGALLLMFFCSFLGIALLNVDNKLLVEIGLLTRSVVFVSLHTIFNIRESLIFSCLARLKKQDRN